MGDVADMMLDGTLCEGCGELLDNSLGEFPQRCAACKAFDEREEDGPLDLEDQLERALEQTPLALKVACPTCKRRVKQTGLKDHMRDKHGINR